MIGSTPNAIFHPGAMRVRVPILEWNSITSRGMQFLEENKYSTESSSGLDRIQGSEKVYLEYCFILRTEKNFNSRSCGSIHVSHVSSIKDPITYRYYCFLDTKTMRATLE